MKKSNKILMSTLIGVIGVSSLVGCGNIQKTEQSNVAVDNVIDYTQEPNDILLKYNEEGMNTLLANYTKKEDMQMALKNIGRVPKDMSFKTINGKSLTITNGKFSGYEDKNVIIDVVQSNCEYCKKSSTVLDMVLKDNKDTVYIPVFVKSTKDEIKKYYEDLGIKMPKTVILDENKEIVDEFNLTKTPTSIFVDKTGKVSYVYVGDSSEEALKEHLTTAFGEKPIYNMVNK